MSQTIEVRVPDIGDFADVPVIEVLVSPGDWVEEEQSLVTLESDKATMEIPSPAAGEILELKVEVDSTVSEGTVIAVLRAADKEETPAAGQETPAAGELPQEPKPEDVQDAPARDAAAAPGSTGHDFDVVVIGAGPGGYTAAFRAADLGLRVALVERYPVLGGVCLNVGCIPSKALLHTASVIDEAAAMAAHGVSFGEPSIDLDKLRSFKDGVVGKLTGGLAGMAGQRKVEVIQGVASFTGAHELEVSSGSDSRSLSFARAIIAVGSQSLELPGMPWGDPRLMDSTAALELEEERQRLAVQEQ